MGEDKRRAFLLRRRGERYSSVIYKTPLFLRSREEDEAAISSYEESRFFLARFVASLLATT
jgi:hypothetical protein